MCGKGQVKPMQCTYCGRDIPDDAVWCPYCGAEQTPPEETTPPDSWQDENIPADDWDDEADPPPDNTWVDDPPVPGWEDDTPYEPAPEDQDAPRSKALLIAIFAALGVALIVLLIALNVKPKPKAPAAAVTPVVTATAQPSAAPTPTPTPTPTPSVTSVTITFLGSKRTEFAAKVGDEVQLSATVYPTGTDQTVTWSSKDESVAKVSDKGVVTGVGKGTTTITAECGGVKADCTVYISAK